MLTYQLDAFVAPTGAPAWPIDLINGDHFLGASSSPSAMAGYPIVNVPAGYAFGLPVGISFMGGAYSEPLLIKFAYAFEQATHHRKPPPYLPTLPLDEGGHMGGPRSGWSPADLAAQLRKAPGRVNLAGR
jgi:amidase